ncbi:tetratricopeptide repeat-containing sensor histidine kinase [Brumimicrobium salinarum]|nr:histidine kinase [Brumimicrobium salinarum]
MLSFCVQAHSDSSYIKAIENASSNEEKEDGFIEWIDVLSQKNTKHCDSIIRNYKAYVPEISQDGTLFLIITFLNNSRLGGFYTIPQIADYNVNASDRLLIGGILKCFQFEAISKKEYELITSNSHHYKDPTRKSLYYILSTCVENISETKKTILFKKALRHAKRSSLKSIYSTILNAFSIYHAENEDFEEAILYQQKGVSYSREHELKANLVVHLIEIGKIHSRLNQTTKSEYNLNKALDLSKDLKIDFIKGEIYNELGIVKSKQNEIKQSIKFFQQSLLSFYKVNNHKGLANTHKNIGRVFYNRNELDLAEKNYKLSYEFFNEFENNVGLGELEFFFAELYYNRKKLSLAEKHLKEAFKHWSDNGLLIPINEAQFLWAKIKNKKGEYEKAYQILEDYSEFNDSLHRLETSKRIAELSEMFKSEQKERKILEQEKQLEEELIQKMLIKSKLENLRQKNQFYIIIIVISILFFAAIILLIRNKNKQEQLKKKQREIELQQALLRSQMNPHFIFNAMSVIQSYIYDEDAKNSSKFLIHFSKLMRLILENNTKEFISLEKEFEIIHRYLILQKMRFEDRFSFTINNEFIADSSSILIPPMLVQPFIENAIEHGSLDTIEDGKVEVNCEIEEDLFIFTIQDNGVGRSASAAKQKVSNNEHSSMAINLTENRIALLNKKYKNNGFLKIENLNVEQATGTKVIIATPFIRKI